MQLHVTISKTSVKVVLDCSAAAEKSVNAAGNITTDGVEILGRTVRSRGRRDSSAPVSRQFFLAHFLLFSECRGFTHPFGQDFLWSQMFGL